MSDAVKSECKFTAALRFLSSCCGAVVLRYKADLNREFDKTLAELERLQRILLNSRLRF
jgi:hypothetical protein